MIHALKEWPEHFADVIDGRKTYEVRDNDRDFLMGDMLALNEFDPQRQMYTGNSCLVYIDHILNDSKFCKDGQVILGIKPCVVRKVTEPSNSINYEADYSVPYATCAEDSSDG